MAAPWFESKPDWFESQKVEVAMNHVYLEWIIRSRMMCLEGIFVVSHPINGCALDQFNIGIAFPHKFPRDLPQVWEVGGRIPRIMDRHVYPDSGACCLFVEEAFWLHHPKGYTVLEYLNGPVHDYFLGQVYFELHKTWPWGDRSHGLMGIFEEYEQILGIRDRKVIYDFIRYLSQGRYRGHSNCPCGTGKRLRDCCGEVIQTIQTRVPRARLEATWRLFERAGEAVIQHAIDQGRVD